MAEYGSADELLGGEGQSLTEAYERAGRPAHWTDIEAGQIDDDLAEFSDQHDLAHLDETPGEHDDNAFFSDAMGVQEAIEQIRAQYEALARPLLAQQHRNPGVRLPALVKLELERERKINAILRPHQRAQALEWAARRQPEVQVRAAERQMEQAALNAFGRDLPGSSRRYHVDEFHGRETGRHRHLVGPSAFVSAPYKHHGPRAGVRQKSGTRKPLAGQLK